MVELQRSIKHLFQIIMDILPFGNCADANLVNRIPAPSIRARRIPPIAADPTMAIGPSEKGRTSLKKHFILVCQIVSCKIHIK